MKDNIRNEISLTSVAP